MESLIQRLEQTPLPTAPNSSFRQRLQQRQCNWIYWLGELERLQQLFTTWKHQQQQAHEQQQKTSRVQRIASISVSVRKKMASGADD